MSAYSKKFARLAAPALLCTILGTLLAACGATAPEAPEETPALYGSDVVGGFDLVDTAGNPVSDEDFLGKYQMVYFGYAFCPDVCPFDVARMVQGLSAFVEANPEFADDIQPIFITVDPDRDTPEKIDEFTGNFSDDLIGLSGSPEAIETAAANYFATFEKLEPNANGDYLMSHTNLGYLVDREGQPMALLPVDETADAVAAELERWVR